MIIYIYLLLLIVVKVLLITTYNNYITILATFDHYYLVTISHS